jgi:phosphoribosyl-ATP pyrophosphohydrolase/phosphoribosyl-AMP cyclohydrolase
LNRKDHPKEGSYTNLLFNKGMNKIAQKVGEEAVELVIEAKDNNEELFLNEDVDLVYSDMFITEKLNETFEINSSNGRKYNFPEFSLFPVREIANSSN